MMKTIKIYDSIGPWGYTVQDIDRELAEANSDDVLVKIYSAGGDVFEGLAIYQALMNYEGKVTTEVVGITASIASVIFLAGEKRLVSDTGFLMIHEAWTMSIGGANDLREDAELLDKINEQILGIYEARTGYDREELKEKMSKDTYMGPDEVLALGFATEVSEGLKIAASIGNHLQLAKGDNMAEKNKAPEAELEAKLEALESSVKALQEENESLKAELAEKSEEAIKAQIEEGIKAEQERVESIKAFAFHEKQGELVAQLIADKTPVAEAQLALAKNFKAEGSAWIASNPAAILDAQAPKATMPEGEPVDKDSIHKEIKALKAEGKFNEANELFNKHFKEIK